MGSPASPDATGPASGKSRPAEDRGRAGRQPPAGQPPDVAALTLAILEELQGSRKQRVNWVREQADGFVKWRRWRREFIRDTDEAIRKLRDAGWEDEAAQVETRLRSSREYTHPGVFNFYWTTSHGHENMTIWLEGTGAQRAPGSNPGGGTGTDDHSSAGSDGESDEEDDDDVDRDDGVCPVCRASGRDTELLACDRCRTRFHAGCLGLGEGPRAGWTCEWCGSGGNMDDSSPAAGNAGAKVTTQDGREGPRELLSCLGDPVDIDPRAKGPEPQAVPIGRQWIARTTSGQGFYINCCRDPVIIPTLDTDPSKPTHELVPGNFSLDPSDVSGVLRHLSVQHGAAKPGRKQLRKLMTPVLMSEPLAWSVAANNMCVREIQGLRKIAWEALLGQYQSGANQSPTTKTVLSSSAARFGTEGVLFRRPGAGDELWLISCTSPDCHQRPMGEEALNSGEAAAHFKSHGLVLDKDQIINLFGFQVIHDGATAGEERTVTGSSPVPEITEPPTQPPPPKTNGEQDAAAATAAKKRTCTTCFIFHRKCDKQLPSCGPCLRAKRTCAYDLAAARVRETRRRVLRKQRCAWCPAQPKYTHGPLDLCSKCSRSLTKATKQPKTIEERSREARQRKAKEFLTLPIETLMRMCDSRGISHADLPRQGQNIALAWKLTQNDEGSLHTSKSKGNNNRRMSPLPDKLSYHQYILLGCEEMKRMCEERGISIAEMPWRGASGWLAGRLRDYDVRRTRAQTAS